MGGVRLEGAADNADEERDVGDGVQSEEAADKAIEER